MPRSARRSEGVAHVQHAYCDVARPHGGRVQRDLLRSDDARRTDAAGRDRRAAVPAIPGKARLHVVTGKGGTGKTTAAVALALALVETGRKVLRRRGRGPAGAGPALRRRPRCPTRSAGSSASARRRLAVGPGDRRRAGDDRVPRHVLRPQALGARAEEDGRGRLRHHARARPARRAAHRQGEGGGHAHRRRPATTYDAVVLDAPPTGRITKFLDATKEVANLTKFGPINRQSEGVIKLLHGKQTAVHLVTLLEEMPVQETIDAAARAARGRLPARRGDRQPGPSGPHRRRARSTRSCWLPACARSNLPAASVERARRRRSPSYADRLDHPGRERRAPGRARPAAHRTARPQPAGRPRRAQRTRRRGSSKP